MPPQNYAAYTVDKNSKRLEVRLAPYTAPGPDELVIRNKAVAINPPLIIGNDVSGVVEEVGSDGRVNKLFKPGDRVVGHAVGTDKRANKSSEGAFQKYTVLRCDLTSKIPGTLSHEQARILPLALSTAACGLFMKDYLAMPIPKPRPEGSGTASVEPRGTVVIVWGGSTSVGSNAIQLARAAGYEVLATSPPKNFQYLRSIGASMVFDYKHVDAVPDIIGALKAKTCAGAVATGVGSLEACIDIVAAVPGRRFVSQASNSMDMSDLPTSSIGLIWTMLKLVWWNISVCFRAKFRRVSIKVIWSSDTMSNEVGPAIYNDFLPDALAKGRYQAKPDAILAGSGLEHLQNAIDLLKRASLLPNCCFSSRRC
ncbi:hypothetical protein JX266_012103 [Neoarthrinium moseri]|nr:hypothetical protein JX266_012103 [Neoarthrinium moseri]